MILGAEGRGQCPTCMISASDYAGEPESAQSSNHSQYGTNTHFGDTTVVATDDTPLSDIQDSATSTILNPSLPLYSEVPETGLVVHNNVSNDLLGNLLAINVETLLEMTEDKREGFLDLKGPLALHYLEALQAVSFWRNQWLYARLTSYSG
jgi:hypothetical protein